MTVDTTNIRKIIEAISEAKKGDVIKTRISNQEEYSKFCVMICEEFPFVCFHFEHFKSNGLDWVYIHIRKYRQEVS